MLNLLSASSYIVPHTPHTHFLPHSLSLSGSCLAYAQRNRIVLYTNWHRIMSSFHMHNDEEMRLIFAAGVNWQCRTAQHAHNFLFCPHRNGYVQREKRMKWKMLLRTRKESMSTALVDGKRTYDRWTEYTVCGLWCRACGTMYTMNFMNRNEKR